MLTDSRQLMDDMVNTGGFLVFFPGLLNPAQQQAVVDFIQRTVRACQHSQLVTDTFPGLIDVRDVGKRIKFE